jgi:glycosyltransferase involved in cell wall biosynthesis
MGIPVVAAERNAPTHFNFTSAARRRWLTFNAFRFAARILVQCQSYRELYPAYLRSNIVIIPNPVFPAERQSEPHKPTNGRFRILSVGRLSYQKNYTALINAFAPLSHAFPQWDLILVGEGEEHGDLAKLVAQHGIADRVSFAGTTKSVAESYSGSNLFCLSSRWEGFPNALAEALAHGLPCVGYADCAGVRDLIFHGENGLLATGSGNVDTLRAALQTLMSSDELRAEMGGNAALSVRRYEPSEIFNLWERTLLGVAS